MFSMLDQAQIQADTAFPLMPTVPAFWKTAGIATADFIGNNSNERIEITGKWKGTFYRNDKSIIRLEKIE